MALEMRQECENAAKRQMKTSAPIAAANWCSVLGATSLKTTVFKLS